MSRGYPARLTDEAKEDGVYLVDGWLAIPCEICGGPVFRGEYSRKRQYVCEQCKKKIKALTHADITMLSAPQTTIDRYNKRFADAVEAIKKQVPDFDCYKSAIRTASKRIDRYGSVPEAMAAIELLKDKFKIIPQQKVGSTKVDFCIPDSKLILEIDGNIYHTDTGKEIRRDANIKYCLGQDWTIIHFPAEKVRKDVTSLTDRLWVWMKENIPQTDP